MECRNKCILKKKILKFLINIPIAFSWFCCGWQVSSFARCNIGNLAETCIQLKFYDISLSRDNCQIGLKLCGKFCSLIQNDCKPILLLQARMGLCDFSLRSLRLVWKIFHDDVIKWKHFPRYWPFMRWVHLSPVNSPHKGQWCGALMYSLIWTWIYSWINNGEAGDLRRHRTHYDVTAMPDVYILTQKMTWQHTPPE